MRALVRDVPLRLHDVDDGVGRVWRRSRSELARLRPSRSRADLDHHHLQAETDAENRHAVFARVADRANLALDSALAEAAGNDYRVGLGEPRRDVLLFELFGVDVVDLDPGLVGDRAVRDRFVQALVRIDCRLTYLPTTATLTVTLGFCAALTIRRHLERFGAPVQMLSFSTHALVETLLVKTQRHFVDRRQRRGAEITQFSSTLQKWAILALSFFSSGRSHAAQQDVGLNPEPGQLLDAVLRGLGLELAGGGNKRHQRQMDVQDVFAAESQRNSRIASRNGRLSISPTVPPISTMIRSAPSAALAGCAV